MCRAVAENPDWPCMHDSHYAARLQLRLIPSARSLHSTIKAFLTVPIMIPSCHFPRCKEAPGKAVTESVSLWKDSICEALVYLFTDLAG